MNSLIRSNARLWARLVSALDSQAKILICFDRVRKRSRWLPNALVVADRPSPARRVIPILGRGFTAESGSLNALIPRKDSFARPHKNHVALDERHAEV
jgi:hypothetical protein